MLPARARGAPRAHVSRRKSHCACAPHGKSPLSGAGVDAKKKVSAAFAAAAYFCCPDTVVSWYSSWYRSCDAGKQLRVKLRSLHVERMMTRQHSTVLRLHRVVRTLVGCYVGSPIDLAARPAVLCGDAAMLQCTPNHS